jgi:hypothetical protein
MICARPLQVIVVKSFKLVNSLYPPRLYILRSMTKKIRTTINHLPAGGGVAYHVWESTKHKRYLGKIGKTEPRSPPRS